MKVTGQLLLAVFLILEGAVFFLGGFLGMQVANFLSGAAAVAAIAAGVFLLQGK